MILQINKRSGVTLIGIQAAAPRGLISENENYFLLQIKKDDGGMRARFILEKNLGSINVYWVS